MSPWRLSVVLALAALVVAALAPAGRRKLRLRRLRPPGRAMGILEHFFDVAHHIGGFVSILVARVEGDVDLAVLRRALDALQAKHPLLRVPVGGPDGLFRDDGTRPIPLRTVVRAGPDHWKAIVVDELEHPIPYGLDPLVRITWIHEAGVRAELVLTANHAVVDGVSAAVMVRDLFAACAGEVPTAAAPPPAEILPLDVGLTREAHRPPLKQPKLALLLPGPRTNVRERHPVVDAHRISGPSVAAMLKRCREEGTTFHGLLSAAALFALGVEFGPDRDLSLSSNVGVRSVLEPPVSFESVGCFIAGVTTIHGIAADAEIWATARSVRAQITGYTAEGHHLRWLAGGFTWLQQFGLRHLLARINDGRINALNISNSGKADIPQKYGALSLSELYFVSSQHVIGSTFQISAVSLADTLFMTFSWARPLLTEEQARRIIATFLRVLDLVEASVPVTVASLSPRNPPSLTRKSA